MLLFQLFQNNPALIIPWLFALVIAITIHEFSHGYAAYRLGDNTAEYYGRLTLNPLAHLDIFGSLMLLLVGFGWAKPVPIDLSKVRKGSLGRFIVSFAGIFANLVIAILGVILIKIAFSMGFSDLNYMVKFLAFLIFIDLALFIFNLLPVAPLDGYRMFEAFFPRVFLKFAPFMERYGFLILIFVVFFTNIIGYLIGFFIFIMSNIFGLPIYELAFGNI